MNERERVMQVSMVERRCIPHHSTHKMDAILQAPKEATPASGAHGVPLKIIHRRVQ